MAEISKMLRGFDCGECALSSALVEQDSRE